jgi:hypothetical protein
MIFPGRPAPFEVFRAVFPYAANRHFVCRTDMLLVEVAKNADFSKNKFREYGKKPLQNLLPSCIMSTGKGW